ncbi:MAG: cobalt-precorrin-6A reductase [Pseudomonadota bacterium]
MSAASDPSQPPILILAGTREARALAAHLSQMGQPVLASLAGVTRDPAPYPCPVRSGGFGGVHGLAAWLQAHRPPALIDATHPFARQMQLNAAAAAAQTGTPRLRLLRPPWPTRQGWQLVPDLAAAAAALPPGARVLLTTGGKEVAAFAQRPDCHFVLRVIEPVADLPPHIQTHLTRPPFSLADEIALLRDQRITHLITKNAGGSGTAKLDAAEHLGLPVIVVDRPPVPPGPLAQDPQTAVDWLATLKIGAN